MDCSTLSYKALLNLAKDKGYDGPGNVKRDVLVAYLDGLNEELPPPPEEIHVPELAAKVEEVVETIEAAAPAGSKKKDAVEARRSTIEEKVRQKFADLTKPVTVTQMFFELFPNHPEGKEAIQKWNDINRTVGKLVNSGEVVATKPEGKRRTVFALKKPEA